MPGDATKGAGASSLLNTLALSLLVITLCLVTRPYQGIVDDSRFYTVQALNEMLHGRFADDLYFQFGSQDQFSIFSRIYEPFLSAFGMAWGNLVLTILADAFWLCGLFHLAVNLFRDRTTMFIAVTLAILLPDGPFFQYGEPFLTPRLFAEAMTLFALGDLVAGRAIRGAILLCISASIHPLMTLPGLGVLFLYAAAHRPVWWVAAIGGGCVLLMLAGFGIQPFNRLLLTFDPAWFAIIDQRNYFCLVSEWNFHEWLPISTTLVLSALVLTVATGHERRLVLMTLIVTVAGLVISLVAGDFFRDVLVVDIQLWRATRLLSVLAHLALAPIIVSLRNRGTLLLTKPRLLLWLAIGLVAATDYSTAFYLVAVPAALLAWAVIGWEALRQRDMPGPVRACALLALAVILGVTFVFLRLFIAQMTGPDENLPKFVTKLVMVILTLTLMVGIAWPKAGLTTHLHPAWAAGLSGLLLLVAACCWNQTSPWTRFVDNAAPPPASLTALLPQGAVYWDGDVDVPWLVLKRDSYFSCDQGTGALFNRGTAMTYQHRIERFRSLNTLDFHSAPFCPTVGTTGVPAVTKDALANVCQRDSGLAAIVLLDDVADAPRHVWISPVAFPFNDTSTYPPTPTHSNHFYIYDCSAYR